MQTHRAVARFPRFGALSAVPSPLCRAVDEAILKSTKAHRIQHRKRVAIARSHPPRAADARPTQTRRRPPIRVPSAPRSSASPASGHTPSAFPTAGSGLLTPASLSRPPSAAVGADGGTGNASAGRTPRLDAGSPTSDVDSGAARKAHVSATRAMIAVQPSQAAHPGVAVATTSPERRKRAKEVQALIKSLRHGAEVMERRLELGFITEPVRCSPIRASAAAPGRASASASSPPPKEPPAQRPGANSTAVSPNKPASAFRG